MKRFILIICTLLAIGTGYIAIKNYNKNDEKRDKNLKTSDDTFFEENERLIKEDETLKTIYLAGGCFWGVEEYFKNVRGIENTEVGYANGKTKDTSYEQVNETGHAETVKVVYDKNIISLGEILLRYFTIIDPTSINKQGNDIGTQYRTGIYYIDDTDKKKIEQVFAIEQEKYKDKITVEVLRLNNFILAEDYHQDYLEKNPGGYCHIDIGKASQPLDLEDFKKDIDLGPISDLQKEVTMNKGTEAPGSSEYDKFNEKGVYVDIYTGQPLFSSSDKFDAGCGWPSFSKPITTDAINYAKDYSYGMDRVEVTSSSKGSHLGHVFEDGPQYKGGLRYCINGASLKFIPYDEMDKYGLGKYKIFID